MMIKRIVITLILPLTVHAQDTCTNPYGESGEMTTYPTDHQQLEDSGFCETFSPPVNDFTRCFWMIPVYDSVYMDVAWSVSNCTNISLHGATFFDEECDTVSSGYVLGGVTGDTIKWCVSGTTSGGANCSSFGFLDVCAYYMEWGVVLLPVEIAPLKALANGDDVTLTWSTFLELNNDHFILEHSTGGAFTTIDMLPGAGTSYARKDYRYTHMQAPHGINYYQLSQVDQDGQVTILDRTSIRVTDLHTYQVFNVLGHLILTTNNERLAMNAIDPGDVAIILRDGLPFKYIGGSFALAAN
jgi:hypothetical protein